MISKDKHKIGVAVIDEHGRPVTVYQDHEGVTLDFGLTDRNFTTSAAAELMIVLRDAINAAALWQADQEQAERENSADAEA